MAICKYFQQGYCRYGPNCKFEHVYGSKYNYQANAQPVQPPSQSGVTDEQLLNQVKADVVSALHSGQWILSSYAPFKEKPIFPGLSDLSPEEARLFIYEAKANNSLDQAVSYFNNLLAEAKSKYAQLLQPTPAILKVCRALYKGEAVSSPFSDAQSNVFSSSNNQAASVFRNAASNSQSFSQSLSNTSSIFGPKQNSVFGPTTQDPARSLFAQAAQTTFHSNQPSNSIFNATSPENNSAKSLFAQASQNVFASNQNAPSNTGNVFSNCNVAQTAQNLFGQANQMFSQQENANPALNTGNIFQNCQSQNSNVFSAQMTPQNVFGQSTTTHESGLYSTMEELSEDDLEQFKRESFKLGFVPELPPPQMLC